MSVYICTCCKQYTQLYIMENPFRFKFHCMFQPPSQLCKNMQIHNAKRFGTDIKSGMLSPSGMLIFSANYNFLKLFHLEMWYSEHLNVLVSMFTFCHVSSLIRYQESCFMVVLNLVISCLHTDSTFSKHVFLLCYVQLSSAILQFVSTC